MKKIILSLIAALSLGTMLAGDAVQLRLSLYNGSSEVFRLDEKPVVTFSNEDMIVDVAGKQFTYSRASIEKMSFVTGDSSVEANFGTEGKLTILNDVVVCEGSAIDIYDLDGRLWRSGRNSLSISDLPKGIYVVKSDKQVVKIINL